MVTADTAFACKRSATNIVAANPAKTCFATEIFLKERTSEVMPVSIK